MHKISCCNTHSGIEFTSCHFKGARKKAELGLFFCVYPLVKSKSRVRRIAQFGTCMNIYNIKDNVGPHP